MSNRLTLSVLLAVALSASLFLASAVQGSAASAPAPASPSSSGSADAVQLSLIAHDKRGEPVLDLKPDELTITEDGVPVKLDNLRLVDQHKDAKQLVSFVFDPFPPEKDAHSQKSSSRIATARDAALKILTLLTESGCDFSVLSIDSRLHLQQSFTSDLNAVKAAIEAATGPIASRDKDHAAISEREIISVALSGADLEGKRVATHDRLQAQSIYAALRNSTRIAQDRHILPSFSSLLALVQSQQNLAGRKTIIYLSSMRQDQISDIGTQAIESIAGAANQANVRVDVVDVSSFGHHGSKVILTNPGSAAIASALSFRDYGTGESTMEVVDDAPIDTDLKRMAEATGGIYLNGDNLKSMRQLTGDMSTYYEASFLPRSEEYDGKLHPLVVTPLRKGLKIRTQTAYLALPPPSADGSSLQPFELPLLKQLKESPLPAQFPFRATVLDMGDSEDGRRSTLAIEVPVENLNLQQDANSPGSLAHVAMIANVKDETGAVAAHFSSDTPQRIGSHQASVKSNEVISLQRHFILPPGKYTLEVLIVDTTSGKAAAKQISFEVSSGSSAPSLGNMILVRRTDPVLSSDLDITDPLRDGKTRIMPNLSGALAAGNSNVSIFFAVHENPLSPQPAKLEIKVLRDGQVLGGAPLLARQVRGGEYYSYLGSFSLNPATDGTYQVEALLTQDGKSAESDTSFTLSGMEGAEADTAGNTSSVESVARPSGPLNIAVSPNPVQRPSDDELKALLAEAAQYANAYWDSLPNFMCHQVTERFVGSHNEKNWEHIDTLSGQLTYFEHQEDWEFQQLEKDQKRNRDSSSDARGGVTSAGVFGGLIRGLFRPAAKAEITWVESDALGDGTVQVFKYRVAKENSNLTLRSGPMEVFLVGYHGMVYIDSATHVVRRITEIADDVPKKSLIRESLVSADYDFVSINNQQYLLPVGAQIVVRRGSLRSTLELNQIRFRDFHRFVSTSRILTGTTISEP
ncbi:VWA domain-containing protein [Acidicapsa dinghuensis]|uniref:VWA domain-containing protein n=1 Tax=Acidicapsa dinghuensis TaxID=2218256 RepID=A0ABW1EHB7_9BACT|nr:VWA domain-containing protein [Acidicapsa dinghuensis]